MLDRLAPARSLDQLRSLISTVPQTNPARAAAETALAALDGQSDAPHVELDAVLASVERWYDNAMDRVSGIYKRRVHTWLLALALGLTLVIGADSFKIVRLVADNSVVRALVVAQASAAVPPASATQA